MSRRLAPAARPAASALASGPLPRRRTSSPSTRTMVESGRRAVGAATDYPPRRARWDRRAFGRRRRGHSAVAPVKLLGPIFATEWKLNARRPRFVWLRALYGALLLLALGNVLA